MGGEAGGKCVRALGGTLGESVCEHRGGRGGKVCGGGGGGRGGGGGGGGEAPPPPWDWNKQSLNEPQNSSEAKPRRDTHSIFIVCCVRALAEMDLV